MTKFYMLFGAVAVIGIGVVGYNVGSGVLGNAVTAPVEVEGLDDPERLVQLATPVSKGNEDAPITIAEFGDYQCPSCGAFAQQVKPQVELSYIESGEAKLVFYDFPIVTIHPNAFFAARAARCADDQGKFWEYHDELFRNQPRWSASATPGGLFEDFAESVGLDDGAFGSCLNSDRHADVVTANMQVGQMMGVSGTPTILINMNGETRRSPGFDFRSIQTTIDEMRAAAGGSN